MRRQRTWGLVVLVLFAVSPLVRRATASPAAGDVAVLASQTEDPSGDAHQILLVDSATGQRRRLSDLSNADRGPIAVWPTDVTWTTDGALLVTDAYSAAGEGGAILRVARDGTRSLWSDLGDPAQGPTGTPAHIAARPGGGAVLVVAGTDPRVLDVRPDGTRALVSDLDEPAQGAVLLPIDIVVQRDGSTVVLPMVSSGEAPLVRVLPSGDRLVLSQLADSPAIEEPTGIADTDTGALRVMDQYGSPTRSLLSVAADGTLSILSRFTDLAQGPIGVDVQDVAVLGGVGDDALDGGTGADVLDGGPGRLDLCTAGERRRRCVDDSAQTIGAFTQTLEVTASDGEESDRFGASVALSGDTLVVGSYRDGHEGGSRPGAVYVLARSACRPGAWDEVAKLTASDGEDGDAFGWAVGISEDTIAVAAPFADAGFMGTEGAAYVFVKPPGGWTTMTETAKLIASDGETDDDLGSAIAISGDTVAVGAPVDGSAYVFVRPVGGWSSMTETAKLTASDGVPDEGFGSAIAIDAHVLVVGAPGHSVGDTVEQGAAYVFVRPSGGWATSTETAKLTATDGAEGDRLGRSVGISGSTVAAGAYLDVSVPDGPWHGSAYVFVEPPGGWRATGEVAKLTASGEPEPASLGWSIAVREDVVVAGAIQADVATSRDQGAAYVFVRPAAGWASMTETSKLTASKGGPDEDFGWYVAIDERSIAVGAPLATVRGGMAQGAAYLFDPEYR